MEANASASGAEMPVPEHAVVVPLYGPCPDPLGERLQRFLDAGYLVVLVQNNPAIQNLVPSRLESLQERGCAVRWLANHNRGGVAGGFNRGIEAACAAGVRWITLLDQDSDLQPTDLKRLREAWQLKSGHALVVGPRIWDQCRGHWDGRPQPMDTSGLLKTRLLISSGTTFQCMDWSRLGPMNEWLVVDFVDHYWSFQVQHRGFQLFQHPAVCLRQRFGEPHPSLFCQRLGMQLYTPRRHYYSLRNLLWLCFQPEVPLDLKLKEMARMLIKPWLWLLFEPNRRDNVHMILRACVDSLVSAHPRP